MDPVTAALNLATASVSAWEKWFDAMTPEQKSKLIDRALANDARIGAFFDRMAAFLEGLHR